MLAQRPGQGGRDPQAGHGEGLGQSLAQASGRAGVGVVELFGQGFEVALAGEGVGVAVRCRPDCWSDRDWLVALMVDGVNFAGH